MDYNVPKGQNFAAKTFVPRKRPHPGVSLTEAFDTTTPSGRAMAGLFAEFQRDLLRERVKAGIAQARKDGRPHGRPVTVAKNNAIVKKLFAEGNSKSEIARRLNIGRTSVRRLLG